MRNVVITIVAITACQAWAQTQNGKCPESAQAYQDRYMQTNQSSDLVCHKKALKRELSGQQGGDCRASAQYYQGAYEQNYRSADLICYKQALRREMR